VGSKPRQHRAVWLSRNWINDVAPESMVNLSDKEPEQGLINPGPRRQWWVSTPHEIGTVPLDCLDIEVPVEKPIRVRLRCEVIE
jgi:hypothetical protein